MASSLIEIPNESGAVTCAQVVEVEGREQARSILPPAFRPHAKFVERNAFTVEEIDPSPAP